MGCLSVSDDIEGFDDAEAILVHVVIGEKSLKGAGINGADSVGVTHEVGG